MKKLVVGGFMLMFFIMLVFAGKPSFIQANVISSRGHAAVTIPETAVEVTDGVFDIGFSIDEKGRFVQGYAFLLKEGSYSEYARPGTVCGDGVCSPGENAKKCAVDCDSEEPPTESSCYVFIDSSGAKWDSQEGYLLDPTNTQGLDEAFIRQNFADAIGEWETESVTDSFGDEIFDFVDYGSIGVISNGKNEVVFGSIENPGVIAVTYVWGIFRGNPRNRRLTEWDMVFDEVDFDWGNSGDVSVMDFENIAQHELGHAFGLTHPANTCVEETMYAYATEGETKKRDLFDGDKAGIFDLYN